MKPLLPSIIKQFEYYKKLGGRTFEQLSFGALKKEFNQDANSIAIIVKHLAAIGKVDLQIFFLRMVKKHGANEMMNFWTLLSRKQNFLRSGTWVGMAYLRPSNH